MPVLVMEASKNEGKGKTKSKSQEGCKEKSILDFFKTPEKEVNSKQKSLLQFFGKTPDTTKNDNNVDKVVKADKENKIELEEEKEDKDEQAPKKEKKKVRKKLGIEKSMANRHSNMEVQNNSILNGDSSDNSLIIVEPESAEADDKAEDAKTYDSKKEKSPNDIQENIESVEEQTGIINEVLEANSKVPECKPCKTVTKPEQDEKTEKTSKRNNLKVKDMLNLLKEVQVSEKKEKKKKNKHKPHKHKSKEVHELNAYESEVPEENNITDPSTLDSAKTLTNGCSVKKSVSENSKQSEITHKSKEENGQRDLQNMEENEKEESGLEGKNSNEMSYSEFLAKLNSSQTEETMEIDCCEGKETEETSVTDMAVDIGVSDDSKLVKNESENMITKFFNYTSTPGKDCLPGKEKKQKECRDKVNEKKVPQKNSKQVSQSSDDLDKVEFLQSKASVSSKNSTQATLSFGSNGLKMSKQKDTSNASNSKETKSVKNGENQCQDSLAKREVNKIDLNSSESVFATPVSKKTRKRKVASYLELSTDLDESDLADQSASGGCRRSQHKKYKVTVFQMDEERKTPIKIKLRRCAKSSSSANEELETSGEEKPLQKVKDRVKNNVKQTKALALLEKAKNRMHKTKLRKQSSKGNIKFTNKKTEKNQNQKDNWKRKENSKSKDKSEESDSDKGSARRSSRLEGKARISMEEVSIDNIVILSDEDEMERESKRRKKKKKDVGIDDTNKILTARKDQKKEKGTPIKQNKVKSPVKKPGVKLAPMFMMGKKKSADSPVKPAEDPEKAKQRQLFLMSGVPDELKKQTAIRQANTLISSYPPIPTINHVQQTTKECSGDIQSKALDVWKLEGVYLNLRDDPPKDSPVPKSMASNLNTVKLKPAICQMDEMMMKRISDKFDEATIDKCLNEISLSNPAYRVKEMYRAMKESKKHADEDQTKTDIEELRTDMKGILSETKDVELEKKPRRSLKLKKKEGEDVKEETTTDLSQPVSGGSSLLWTDKYYPMKASEILGNGASLKKLKDWLLEWKQVLDREARKAHKLLMKKNKGKLPSSKGKNWDDDDSDFDIDSEDSEDDTSLCNTTLLVGPHGCGKTSSVYALAQELGFKVHEVNASSSRTGRQILSQLQEATQSHQVSSQGCHTPSKKKGHVEKPVEESAPPKSKMALAFTNLLNNQSSTDKKTNESEQKKKKSKKSEKDQEVQSNKVKDMGQHSIKNKQMAALISEDSNSQSFASSINLSRTTLILFEEVDVSFEDDKGFIQAVQTFMSSTKIPIILTSNKRTFSPSFDGRFEVILMKKPSVVSLTSHLQTIALTENMRTDFVKLSELVKMKGRDVRQCILMLQYLVTSGGTHDQCYKVLEDVATPKTQTSTSNTVDQSVDLVPSGNVDKSDDDLDDFVVLKGQQNKRRRILEDPDSNSGDSVGNRLTQVPVVKTECDLNEARKHPIVFGLGLKCLLHGLIHSQKQSCIDCIQEYLKEHTVSSTEALIDICQTFYNMTRTSLSYNNLHLLLPWSFTMCDNVRQISVRDKSNKKKGIKRKRIQCDLYDSEGSDTEQPVGDTKNTDKDTENNSNNATERGQTSGLYNSCVSRSLSSFASFYDTMSSLDIIKTSCDRKNRDRICRKGSIRAQTQLPPGLEDELCNFQSVNDLDIETVNVIHSHVETRAFCKLFRNNSEVKADLEKCEDLDSHVLESFTLPITVGMEEFQLCESGSLSTSNEQQRHLNDIRDNLPYILHKNMQCVHTDYIPTLREICRCESLRQTSNTKRRFHHYLDSITLPLRDKTMAILTSTFT